MNGFDSCDVHKNISGLRRFASTSHIQPDVSHPATEIKSVPDSGYSDRIRSRFQLPDAIRSGFKSYVSNK
ncbi:MAG: hypothetical protein LBM08_10885 [Dysgonamonadaceae bacterium]|nr:hypothetical protein [Dysgonamonadaceae bacterium]